MKKALFYTLIFAASAQLVIAAPKVVSSIYPLQQIANAIVGEPTDLVADSYLSPHNYTVKPNDGRKIINADLFLWVNEMIIPQLHTYVDRREDKKKITITAAKIIGMELLKFGGSHKHGEHEHYEHSHGHNHVHSKMAYDSHVWLSTYNAKIIANELAKQLSQIDNENQALYEENLAVFIKSLEVTKQNIITELKDSPPKPFFIFHDAYQYFEKEFGIRHVAVIRAHSGQAPLTKHLAELEKTLKTTSDACLFREPQFKSPLFNQLTTKSTVVVSVLDPLGYQKENQYSADGYARILKNIAKQLSTCGK